MKCFRNMPFGVQFDDWDDEWAASLRGRVGFTGRSIEDQLAWLRKGDTIEILSYPVIPVLRAGTSRQVAKAWLKISEKLTTADPTENAAWTSTGGMQSITTANSAGIGQILNAFTPELRFDLTRTNTNFLTGNQTYYFECQVLMDDGSIYTVEAGHFTMKPALITDVS